MTPNHDLRIPLIYAVARDNVLISPDVLDFLLTVPQTVQFTKRVIKDLRADGTDPLVLNRDHIVQWTMKDPANRRVVR
ncbi:MAG: hypothetical protein GXX95_01310 [Methanomassiliicoccus sp.]|nr:hypothetical protein [Methanomassiliicoccus sp.]